MMVLAGSLAAPRALAAPLPESLEGRRAVRGAPVAVAHESDALRQLREFDQESFPQPAPGEPRLPDGSDAAGSPEQPRAPLTGGVGPDAIPDPLRSPDRAHEGSAPAPAIPWLSQVKLPDLPVRLDARVLRYLEFYKNDPRGRAIMRDWLKAQGRYSGLIEDALRRAKLPLGLLYVSMIESGYDPHDRSSAGAVGLWQFMPAGAHIYGLRVDYWVDERKDPEKATQAVTHYFADLGERFGAWPLALAAFNAGYGAVLHAMQKYNTNDYWELCRHEDGLPWDTVLYVPKAMATAIVGENKKLFGYDDVKQEAPFQFDRVAVPSSMSFAAIARAAGASESEIAALNPELRRRRTPPDGKGEVRVPKGAGARFTAAYEAHKESVQPYVVRFGERVDDIARVHGLGTRELRALNGIDDVSEVRAGLTLVVPSGRVVKPVDAASCDTVIVAVPDKDAAVAGRKRIFYRTLPGDSADDVARFFQIKPGELQRWNNLDPAAKLVANLVLQLWVAKDFDTDKAALVDASVVRVVTTGSDEFFDLVEAKRGRARLAYAVKKGDDLKKIGKRFGLTVADLERINRFGAQHTALTVGQKITVYRTMTPKEREKAACSVTPGGTRPGPAPPEEDPALDAGGGGSDGDDAAPLPLSKLPRLGDPPRSAPGD